VTHAPAQEGIVLKEFRSLMQMLDGLDGEPSALVPPAERAAEELPQSIEPQPSAAGPKSSSFIYDSNREHAEALAAMLWTSQIDTEIFTETSALVRGLLLRPPSMVFVEVDGEGDGAIDALFALGERNYAGGVQLMGTELTPVLDVVKRMGERHSLQMLPALRKPLRESAVRKVLATQKLAPQAPASSMLDEALTQDWIEFWYQPKIDLVKRQISGVETFARMRHPELGTLPPAGFMRGATEADLLRLTEHALKAALSAASNFSQVGISLRVAVNVPVRALFDLAIVDMVRELGPRTARWPGLLLDVAVGQLGADFARVRALGPELGANNIHLAIDDFGKGNVAVASIEQLPVAELKLDRSFVNGCADDPHRAKVCRGVIELAHRLGCVAVAVGIEQLADLKAIGAMGCDLGQGFLFGQPMPEQELVGLLLKRAVAAPASRTRSPVPARPSPAAAPPPLKRSVWN
jgi:EAL domain-containing protein (putative c-di-GMP-specific phosphodiesterase class I)